MNRNVSAVILVVLAIGIYVTYTSGKWDEVKAVRTVNDGYIQAIANADRLIKQRDKVLKDYNALSSDDKDRLNKMVPNTVDTIRLVIDLNNLASKRGMVLTGIQAVAASANAGSPVTSPARTQNGAVKTGIIAAPVLDTVKLTFAVSAPYQQFIDFMKDVEANLRIMDIDSLNMTSSDNGIYNFNVALRTYWLRQQ